MPEICPPSSGDLLSLVPSGPGQDAPPADKGEEEVDAAAAAAAAAAAVVILGLLLARDPHGPHPLPVFGCRGLPGEGPVCVCVGVWVVKNVASLSLSLFFFLDTLCK